MGMEKLKTEVLKRLVVLESANLPQYIKQSLAVKLDGIMLNIHNTDLVIDRLYWYLRTLQELHGAGKIDNELYAKLFIDPAIVLQPQTLD
jgi:hypothetical protein